MGDYLLTIESVEMLENKLKHLFQPVKPNPVFIDRLQRRLTSSTPTVLERRPRIRVYLIIVLGIICGAFLFWIMRRQFTTKN
jgi:hypothetical protein